MNNRKIVIAITLVLSGILLSIPRGIIRAQTGNWTRPDSATASGSYRSPARAIDGWTITEWQNDDYDGWIEFSFDETQTTDGCRIYIAYSDKTVILKQIDIYDGSSWATEWSGSNWLTGDTWNVRTWTAQDTRKIKLTVRRVGFSRVYINEFEAAVIPPPTPTPTNTPTATPTECCPDPALAATVAAESWQYVETCVAARANGTPACPPVTPIPTGLCDSCP